MLFIILAYLIVLSFTIKKSKSVFLLSILPLFLLIVIRYGVGSDYFSYKLIYSNAGKDSIIDLIRYFSDIDPLFLIVIKSFTIFRIPYSVFAILVSSSILFLLANWIYNNSKEPVISILLLYSMFYFVWVLSTFRQGLVLALALNLLFSKNSKPGKFRYLLIVLLLSLIHKSALFLILFMFIDQMNLNSKKHLVLLGVSLLFTLLPLSYLFSNFSFIPVVKRALDYLSNGVGFWSFSGLSRIALYVSVYIFYDQLKRDAFTKKLTDMFLLGLSLYFFLNFIEVASGRFGIFSLMSIIILIPEIYTYLNMNKLFKVLVSVSIAIFSSVYFMKELKTLYASNDYVNTSIFQPVPTIFNKNNFVFNSYSAVYTEHVEYFNTQYKEFQKRTRKNELELVSVDANLSYAAVYDQGKEKYLIVDSNGNHVTDAIFDSEPKVHLHYLKYNGDGNNKIVYYDMLNEIFVDDTNLINEIDQAQRIEFNPTMETYLSLDMLNENMIKLLEVPEEAENFLLKKYEEPITYYVLTMDYFYKNLTILLDENMELLVDQYYYSMSRIDSNGFYYLDSSLTSDLYHINGNLIWMNKNK